MDAWDWDPGIPLRRGIPICKLHLMEGFSPGKNLVMVISWVGIWQDYTKNLELDGEISNIFVIFTPKHWGR